MQFLNLITLISYFARAIATLLAINIIINNNKETCGTTYLNVLLRLHPIVIMLFEFGNTRLVIFFFIRKINREHFFLQFYVQ